MNSLVYICFLIRSNIPNRSTFVCPFCGARNLDQQELVKHCMDNHRNDPNKVVRNKQTVHYVLFTCRKAFNPEADEELCHNSPGNKKMNLQIKQQSLLSSSLGLTLQVRLSVTALTGLLQAASLSKHYHPQTTNKTRVTEPHQTAFVFAGVSRVFSYAVGRSQL